MYHSLDPDGLLSPPHCCYLALGGKLKKKSDDTFSIMSTCFDSNLFLWVKFKSEWLTFL